MLFNLKSASLGKRFEDGEVIVRQNDPPGSMFIILEGRVEILVDDGGEQPFQVTVLERDNVFGGISLYDRSPRITTARAIGNVRVLTLDKKGFLQWLGEDPSHALRIFLRLAERIRTLIDQVVTLRREVRRLKGELKHPAPPARD